MLYDDFRLSLKISSVKSLRHRGDKNCQHPAIFPEKLAEDHILSWSDEGDVVLDPMCGSGTTCKMAAMNSRQWIGMDISEEYIAIANAWVCSAGSYGNQSVGILPKWPRIPA